ncbi:hypothetical protein GCM10009720_22920 [Yaniella flava]|uniref:Uncharacterized protein n=1 Tax=Yaniella flava TaxID=287930 RepID=A0ABP5G9P1_9MICC
MERTPRDQLQELLASIDTESVDSATLSLPAAVLELHIDGLGTIDMPIEAASAEQLKSVARPAHVGKGEETLHDPSVRDEMGGLPHLEHKTRLARPTNGTRAFPKYFMLRLNARVPNHLDNGEFS